MLIVVNFVVVVDEHIFSTVSVSIGLGIAIEKRGKYAALSREYSWIDLIFYREFGILIFYPM